MIRTDIGYVLLIIVISFFYLNILNSLLEPKEANLARCRIPILLRTGQPSQSTVGTPTLLVLLLTRPSPNQPYYSNCGFLSCLTRDFRHLEPLTSSTIKSSETFYSARYRDISMIVYSYVPYEHGNIFTLCLFHNVG